MREANIRTHSPSPPRYPPPATSAAASTLPLPHWRRTPARLTGRRGQGGRHGPPSMGARHSRQLPPPSPTTSKRATRAAPCRPPCAPHARPSPRCTRCRVSAIPRRTVSAKTCCAASGGKAGTGAAVRSPASAGRTPKRRPRSPRTAATASRASAMRQSSGYSLLRLRSLVRISVPTWFFFREPVYGFFSTLTFFPVEGAAPQHPRSPHPGTHKLLDISSPPLETSVPTLAVLTSPNLSLSRATGSRRRSGRRSMAERHDRVGPAISKAPMRPVRSRPNRAPLRRAASGPGRRRP